MSSLDGAFALGRPESSARGASSRRTPIHYGGQSRTSTSRTSTTSASRASRGKAPRSEPESEDAEEPGDSEADDPNFGPDELTMSQMFDAPPSTQTQRETSQVCSY